MNEQSTLQPTIVRTSRGLSIAGTRITLYDVMDYVQAGQSPAMIQELLKLTDQQIADALAYIEQHRVEVEAEYQQVLSGCMRSSFCPGLKSGSVAAKPAFAG